MVDTSAVAEPEFAIQRLRDRLWVVSETVRAFTESATEYRKLLQTIAERVAEVIGDYCSVGVISEDGQFLLNLADHDRDPGSLTLIREVTRKSPLKIQEQPALRGVIEGGEILLLAETNPEQLLPLVQSEYGALIQRLDIHSVLLAPLRVYGRSLGCLTLLRHCPKSAPFTAEDRNLAQILSDHAALAITNARLFDSVEQELAERKRAEQTLSQTEEQLRQAQKIEAIGRLAGGVAHDFNNLLSVVLSYSAMLIERLSPGDPMRGDLEEIKKAGERAAAVTRQLLAFSRQQVLDPRVVDLNEVVAGLDKMLRRLIGEDVELWFSPAEHLGKCKVDPNQIEQVIMNLVLNARDAMPNGGKLTLETANISLDEAYVHEHVEASPGPHVMLAVSDTGSGMDRETQAKIFEPFFTTKDKDRGTGLGLSTVFGIVKQSGGNIGVYSEPEKGTTFKIYLPRTSEVDTWTAIPPSDTSKRGTETILLVEDDEQVRVLARGILRGHGYHVLDASNGGEALLICEQHGAHINLLLTDVVLPRMSGRQLAKRLSSIRPDMRILYMSGYAPNTMVSHGVLDSGLSYIQKPITPNALLRRVREVLDFPKMVRAGPTLF